MIDDSKDKGQKQEAIALRKGVEDGQIKIADLNQKQVGVVLASIEADEAAGQEVSDRALEVFWALSDQVSQMQQMADFARTAANRVANGQAELADAMDVLARSVGGQHDYNVQMSAELGRVAAASGNFREQSQQFNASLAALQRGFGAQRTVAG
jgi:hypothetical protein